MHFNQFNFLCHTKISCRVVAPNDHHNTSASICMLAFIIIYLPKIFVVCCFRNMLDWWKIEKGSRIPLKMTKTFVWNKLQQMRCFLFFNLLTRKTVVGEICDLKIVSLIRNTILLQSVVLMLSVYKSQFQWLIIRWYN